MIGSVGSMCRRLDRIKDSVNEVSYSWFYMICRKQSLTTPLWTSTRPSSGCQQWTAAQTENNKILSQRPTVVPSKGFGPDVVSYHINASQCCTSVAAADRFTRRLIVEGLSATEDGVVVEGVHQVRVHITEEETNLEWDEELKKRWENSTTV